MPVCLKPGYQIMEKTGTDISPAIREEKLLSNVLLCRISYALISTSSIFRALQDEISAQIKTLFHARLNYS